ncbi:MAG: glycosyltransferase family 4 protein [bacterium]
MKILAKPGLYSKLKGASSPQCLYSELLKLADVEVEEWSPVKMIFSKYDLLHIHWPDNILGARNQFFILLKIILLTISLKIVRFKKSKIIWTSHNIESHYNVNSYLENLFWKFLLRNVDGIITPSYSIKEQLINKHPQVKSKRIIVTPFGDWSQLVPNEVDFKDSRLSLNIPNNDFLIIWIGGIRPYKGLETLIQSFKKLPNNNIRLIIGGIIFDSNYEAKIQKLTNKDSRIIIHSGFIPNEKLQIYYNAANLAVFPFKKITNSGSVRLALHFDCPVLVPDFPIFKEMEKNFGSTFIKLYPKNTRDISFYLNYSIKDLWIRKTNKVNWGVWNWSLTAKKYYDFCQNMI